MEGGKSPSPESLRVFRRAPVALPNPSSPRCRCRRGDPLPRSPKLEGADSRAATGRFRRLGQHKSLNTLRLRPGSRSAPARTPGRDRGGPRKSRHRISRATLVKLAPNVVLGDAIFLSEIGKGRWGGDALAGRCVGRSLSWTPAPVSRFGLDETPLRVQRPKTCPCPPPVLAAERDFEVDTEDHVGEGCEVVSEAEGEAAGVSQGHSNRRDLDWLLHRLTTTPIVSVVWLLTGWSHWLVTSPKVLLRPDETPTPSSSPVTSSNVPRRLQSSALHSLIPS